MDKLLAFFAFILGMGIALLVFPHGGMAVVVCLVSALAVMEVTRRLTTDVDSETKLFLRRIFVSALLIRVVIAALTFAYGLQEFFGPDALGYDAAGHQLVCNWFGLVNEDNDLYGVDRLISTSGAGWGMSYLVAFIYTVAGRNPLAGQLFISVLGAATALLTYSCAKQIYNNERVARITAFMVAFYPSIVLWSTQLMKDGVIVFLLVLIVAVVLHLQKRMNYPLLALLFVSMIGVFIFRFYIFFALGAAVVGSFLIGPLTTITSIVQRITGALFIGLILTYVGLLKEPQRYYEQFSDLRYLQEVRLDQVRSGGSGYGENLDISTTEGLVTALPVGFTYLMFAPFPWEVSNVRQTITIPEMVIWYAAIPFVIYGIWYTLKTRLRTAIPVLLFTIVITIAYSVFQGNIGAAYRQRSQMLVFYFTFAAVGVVLMREDRENKDVTRRGHFRKLP